jgi:hypothetical protein
MGVFKLLKTIGGKVADKVSDTMETKKRYTYSRKRMKKSEYHVHSAWGGDASATIEGNNRLTGKKAMFGEKGGSSRDVSEFNRHMARNDKNVKKNVAAFKLLKSVRDKVKKKKMSKEEGKSVQRKTRYDIEQPNEWSVKSKPPPGGAQSKAHRGFKKGVKKELKRSEREDSLRGLEWDIYRDPPPPPKPKPSMFIKRKN